MLNYAWSEQQAGRQRGWKLVQAAGRCVTGPARMAVCPALPRQRVNQSVTS